MKPFFCIALFFHLTILFSQSKNKGNLFGVINNKINKTPISYATVICKDLNNHIISGTITDDTGKFTLNKLPLDNFNLEIQFISYKTLFKKITLTKENPKQNLGALYLEIDTTLLDEIAITSEESTVIQKADRKIINVGKDLLATGSNSLQMLQNISSVDVNLQSGAVSLRGNENVRVLINGKPSNLSTTQLLKQTPSSMVKSIEIITSPSAKYNPEGMSGIINFILKKNSKLGLNATISLGAEHSKKTRPDASFNINYSTGKVNFFGDFSTNFGKQITLNSIENTNSNLVQNIDFLHDYVDFTYKVGFDFYLNDTNTLSVYSYQSSSNSTLLTDTFTQLENTTLTTPNTSRYKEPEETYNIDYKLDLDDKGQNIELELNYSINNSTRFDRNSLLEDSITKLYNYNNDIIDSQKSWLINLDYTKPIFKDGNLEFGFEYRDHKAFNSINTDQTIAVGDPTIETSVGNTKFNYDRKILSTYTNLQKQFSKFSIQAGVRLEQFMVDGTFSNTQQLENSLYTDKIFNIYPSAFITYNLTDENALNFSYNRRIDRPALNQVTPIEEWTSPLSISIGNQNLKPQFTNSVELNYTINFLKGSFSLGTFYRKTTDKIGRSLSIDANDSDRQYYSYDNFESAESYGFEMSASYKPFYWWTLRPSLDIYNQNSQGIINDEHQSVSNTLFKTNFSNRFKIGNNLSLQLTTIYRGENQTIQFKVAPYTLVNAGASLTVLDKKGTISVRASDIFNNTNFKYSSITPVAQQGAYELEYNTIYLGFSYSFEGNKSKTRNRKERENNESNSGLF